MHLSSYGRGCGSPDGESHLPGVTGAEIDPSPHEAMLIHTPLVFKGAKREDVIGPRHIPLRCRFQLDSVEEGCDLGS